MLKLINSKIAARKATRARLQKEVPMINELITKASDDGKFFAPININEYSSSLRVLLKKAGYEVEYDKISWAHMGVEIDEDEESLIKLATDAGVEIVDVSNKKPQ